MSSEGKLLAPKPIRRNVNIPALKYSKSIGCPAINPKIDLISNLKFSDNSNEIHKMASTSFFPVENFTNKNENEVAKKLNFISYEEFENEINEDLSKQSATSEILSILSNSKNNKFDCDYVNVNKNINNKNNYSKNNYNNNKINFQTNYKNSEFSVQNCNNNSPPKNFKLVLNSENPIISNATTQENSNVINNNLKNTAKINIPKEINCNNHSSRSDCFTSFSKREEYLNNYEAILNCFENYEKENISDFENSIFDKNLFTNVQQRNNLQNNYLANKNQIQNKNNNYPISPNLENDHKNGLKSEIEIKKKEIKKNLFEEVNSSNYHNNHCLKNIENNILYFLDENFFLELKRENYNNINFASNLQQGNLNNQLKKTKLNPVPSRCTNPFEKSFSIDGCNKIQKFLTEEIKKDEFCIKKESIKHYNPKPDFIENLLFLEQQTLKVRK